MIDSFDFSKDAHGNLVLKVLPYQQQEFDEAMQRVNLRGRPLPQYAALLILQDRLARLEALFTPVAPLPPGARPATPTMRRKGRRDKVPYGWRIDPKDDKRLLPDRAEVETIAVIRVLAGKGLSQREVCRRLDQQGRTRRGRRWSDGGGRGLVRDILRRAGAESPAVPPPAHG